MDIRIGRIVDSIELNIIYVIAVIPHDRAVRNRSAGRCHGSNFTFIQRDILRAPTLLHRVIFDFIRPVVGLIRRFWLRDIEIERGGGDRHRTGEGADGCVVERVVLRIIPGEVDRPTKGNGLLPIGAVGVAHDILIRHICGKGRCIERNIITGYKACSANTTRGQRLDECILYRFLPVIHACDVEISARQLHLARVDRNIDTTQIRTVLIRPEDRLCAYVADAVCLVKVLCAAGHIIVNLALVNIALVDNVGLPAHRCVRRADNLDIFAVVLQSRNICAVVRLDGGGGGICGRMPCIVIEIAIVVRRRRCPAHKGGQHRRGTPLVDAPLRPRCAVVVDIKPVICAGRCHGFRGGRTGCI